MANLSNPQLGGGHEAIALYGFEAGMLADNATTLGTIPTMFLMGYASAPGIDAPDNPTPRRGVGSARRLGKDKPGRREPVIPGSFLLSGSQSSVDLIRLALRYDPTIPAAQRHECLPLFAMATGLAGRCNTALDDQEVGRYCLMESVSIAWAEGQDTRVTFRAQALSLLSSTAFSSPSEAAIIAAGGDAFNSAELHTTFSFNSVAGGGFDNVFNSLTLTINNPIARSGTRHPDLTNGLANPVSNIAYFFEVGDEDITLECNTKARLPALDAMTLINENANDYLGFALGGLTRVTRGRDEVQPGGRAGFPSTYSVATCDLLLS